MPRSACLLTSALLLALAARTIIATEPVPVGAAGDKLQACDASGPCSLQPEEEEDVAVQLQVSRKVDNLANWTPVPGPPGGVSCGRHNAATCMECPQGNGAAWCNGDCKWFVIPVEFGGGSVCTYSPDTEPAPTPAPTPSPTVSCGSHLAASCAACPQGHGEAWCHGECMWTGLTCASRGSAGEGSVSCGSHFASSCAECPQGHGSKWCNGECMWTGSTCASVNSVSCGAHTASSCAECPQGHGAKWCNGDCRWSGWQCVSVGPR